MNSVDSLSLSLSLSVDRPKSPPLEFPMSLLRTRLFTLISFQYPHVSSEPAPPSQHLHLKMSTPSQYYQSLPPVSKTYGVICLMTSGAYHLGLYNVWNIALSYEDVFKRLQVWRLITNFFFLGPFSFTFAFRLLIIARYGVQLERGTFAKRTADYVWMFLFGALSLLVIAVIPYCWSPFMGASLVFMIVYVWSREFPNVRVNIQGLVELKGFYLPWYMLAIDLILGNPLKPDIIGMVTGHLYYFLTVLYPLSGGRNICKTPFWVHKIVAYWGEGFQLNAPVQQNPSAGVAFQGRSYRLDGTRTRADSSARAQTRATPEQSTPAAGTAFQGRSHRLNSR